MIRIVLADKYTPAIDRHEDKIFVEEKRTQASHYCPNERWYFCVLYKADWLK